MAPSSIKYDEQQEDSEAEIEDVYLSKKKDKSFGEMDGSSEEEEFLNLLYNSELLNCIIKIPEILSWQATIYHLFASACAFLL